VRHHLSISQPKRSLDPSLGANGIIVCMLPLLLIHNRNPIALHRSVLQLLQSCLAVKASSEMSGARLFAKLVGGKNIV
jgi:hypothetical protein